MDKNEKRRAEIFAEPDAPKAKMKIETQMNFNTPTEKINNSRRDLLESTKISRLPTIPKRDPNQPAASLTTTECAGCGARLEADDPICQRFCACRKCAAIYGRIITAMDEKSERQQRIALARMFGGQI